MNENYRLNSFVLEYVIGLVLISMMDIITENISSFYGKATPLVAGFINMVGCSLD